MMITREQADREALESLQTLLGYHFKDVALLLQALTHRSYSHEHLARPEHNERLEFLGDAVLKLSTSVVLLEQFPKAKEGDVSRMRAWLVSDNH